MVVETRSKTKDKSTTAKMPKTNTPKKKGTRMTIEESPQPTKRGRHTSPELDYEEELREYSSESSENEEVRFVHHRKPSKRPRHHDPIQEDVAVLSFTGAMLIEGSKFKVRLG